jgi:hypothetical protein
MTFTPRLLLILACASCLLLTACSEDSDNGGTTADGTSGADGSTADGTSGADGSTSGTSGADGSTSGTEDTSGSTSGDTSGTTFSCDEVPTESKAGQDCAAPSECDTQTCVSEAQGAQAKCRQPCVVNTCTDQCQAGESCLPAADQSGKPILIPGTTDKYVGFCIIPPALDCSQIGIATQVDQACSQSNNTCEAGASACIVTQQGATDGNCKQLCSPGKCTDMCTSGKTCQSIGQNFPDGSPIGICAP